MSGAGPDDRLEQAEMALAHLSRSLEDLSDVVVRQGREIALLQRRLNELMTREAERGTAEGPPADQKPPHW